MKKTLTFLFAICFYYLALFAQNDKNQEVPNFLLSKPYDVLYDLYFENFDNDSLYKTYTKAYLRKAFSEKDTLNIARGFYLLTYKGYKEFYHYNDSLIKYAHFLDKKRSTFFFMACKL